jgi:hypothetical protein
VNIPSLRRFSTVETRYPARVLRGVTALATVACALAAVLAADGRTSASPWTRLPDGPPINFYEAALARTHDGTLHVVYARNGGTTQDVWHVPVTSAGHVGAPTAIASAWAAAENPDVVVAPDGTLRAFWGGIMSIAPTNKNDSLNTASGPASGSSWMLQPGRVSSDSNAYVSPTAAAVTKDGEFVEAWTSTFGMRFHFGLTPAQPEVRLAGNCCYYDPGLAVDSATGQTVLGWYSNENAATAGSVAGPGMFLQEISPAGVVGARTLAPGSASADGRSALATGYRTPVTSRMGASGVYLVYGAGYPTFLKVDVLRFGSAKPSIQIPAEGALGANVAAAPQGRLWIFWKRANVIYATRTNRAVTRVEPISAIAPPAGTDTVWRLDGNGTLGPLDLVANVQTSDAAFWYRRVLPRLSLHASSLGQGDVRFVVTDAGDPVGGAKVTLRGRVATTTASGVTTLHVARGSAQATATKGGYIGASAHLVVR